MTSWQHEVGQQVTLCLQLQSYLNALEVGFVHASFLLAEWLFL